MTMTAYRTPSKPDEAAGNVFARKWRKRCPRCRGTQRVSHYMVQPETDACAPLHYACEDCGFLWRVLTAAEVARIRKARRWGRPPEERRLDIAIAVGAPLLLMFLGALLWIFFSWLWGALIT